MTEDRLLLKRLRRGDRDALRRVYEKYMDELLAVAASLLSDVHAAEDCLHDVFVGFAGAAGTVRIRRNLKGYLITCVANRARDRLQKRSRQQDCQLEEADCPKTSADPATELIDGEDTARVFQALAELPYEQRETFVLHVQGEMKFREIARMVDVSIGTVQSRYRYAIEKLRSLLAKENKDEAC
jgi:RNA polymerase sigma-70 factor (ECF subfamily)